MKDITKRVAESICGSITNPLERIEAALHFLYEDKTISLEDKVAGDYDYEELLALLITLRDDYKQQQEADDWRAAREEIVSE